MVKIPRGDVSNDSCQAPEPTLSGDFWLVLTVVAIWETPVN